MKEKIEQLAALNHQAELGGGEDRIAETTCSRQVNSPQSEIELLLRKVAL